MAYIECVTLSEESEGSLRFIGVYSVSTSSTMNVNLTNQGVPVGAQVGLGCPSDLTVTTTNITKTSTSGNAFVGTVDASNATIKVTSGHSSSRNCSIFAVY